MIDCYVTHSIPGPGLMSEACRSSITALFIYFDFKLERNGCQLNCECLEVDKRQLMLFSLFKMAANTIVNAINAIKKMLHASLSSSNSPLLPLAGLPSTCPPWAYCPRYCCWGQREAQQAPSRPPPPCPQASTAATVCAQSTVGQSPSFAIQQVIPSVQLLATQSLGLGSSRRTGLMRKGREAHQAVMHACPAN